MINYKYILVTDFDKKDLDSYFGDNYKMLKEYAEFRKFKEYKIYELREVNK